MDRTTDQTAAPAAAKPASGSGLRASADEGESLKPEARSLKPDGRPADWRSVLDDLVCDFEDQWSVGPRPSVEEFVAARLRAETGSKTGPEPGPKTDEVRRFVAVAELAKAEFELALTQQGD